MDLDCINSSIRSHLSAPKFSCEVNSIVGKNKAASALQRHIALERATKAYLKVEGVGLELSLITDCIAQCKSNDVAPPAFLSDVLESTALRWASNILFHIPSNDAWTPMDVFGLQATVRSALRQGLCYRCHVAAVDGNMNASSLADYVRCVKFIWKENSGTCNPACVQALRKVFNCTTVCSALICDYARIEASRNDCLSLTSFLSRVQSCVHNGFVSSGMSNFSAYESISLIQIDDSSMRALDSAGRVLEATWDFFRGNVANDAHETLPGLLGSHVPSFTIPKRVAEHASPRVVINCIASAILLSKQAYGQMSSVLVSPSEPEVAMLANGIRGCVRSMSDGAHVGSSDVFDTSWWHDYKNLLMKLYQATGAAIGMSHCDYARQHSSVPEVVDSRTSTLSTLTASNAAFENSSVGKVKEAYRLFDAVVVAIGKGVITASISAQSSGESVVVGRLFSDLKAIASAPSDIAQDVVICSRDRNVAFKDYSSGIKFLNLLLEYMKEMSMPRKRRAHNNKLVKRNETHCANDKRRSASR